jgi:hypothetical protein
MLVDTSDYHGLIFDRLIDEHREIQALLEATLALADDAVAARRIAFAQLDRLIRLHAEAEERIVFPVLDGSYELGHHVREDQAEHRIIDTHLRAIAASGLSGPGWRDLFEALHATLMRHFVDEEKIVFPRALCVISSPDSQRMLYEYEQDREYLATHPH